MQSHLTEGIHRNLQRERCGEKGGAGDFLTLVRTRTMRGEKDLGQRERMAGVSGKEI